MSIDEAIAHEREVAKEQKSKYDKCPTRTRYCCEMCFHNLKCNESAEEHEQLAEWLEELKALRHDANEWRKAGYAHGYNKAIDDYRTEICKAFVQAERNGNYRFYAVEIKQLIADLGEQLKDGGVDA